MIATAWAALLLLAPAESPQPTERSEVRARERAMMRVPMRHGPPASPIKWRERRGPRCLSLEDIRGASVGDPGTVDMILRGGKRVRARLERACPALDYYSGFYLRSGAGDRMICAGRDAVHARSGGECEIERFRRLEAPRQR